MAAHIEDYSASHQSLGLLFDATENMMREVGVPTIGSYNAAHPEPGAPEWDQPTIPEEQEFFGLHDAPEGYPAQYGKALAVANASPSRVVDVAELNLSLHGLLPEAAGVLALSSTLRIVYQAPYYDSGADGGVPDGALPVPPTCTFVLPNPYRKGIDHRMYVVALHAKRDLLRPERGIEFNIAGHRHDVLPNGNVVRGDLTQTPLITQKESEVLRDVVHMLPALPDRNWVRRLQREAA